MVRRGTVYIAARLLWRTWRTESEFCVICFCHLVVPLWLYRAVWDPSRMGEPPLFGLFGYVIWMSLVCSRWGGISFPLLKKKRQQRLRHRPFHYGPWEHLQVSRPRRFLVFVELGKHIFPFGVLWTQILR